MTKPKSDTQIKKLLQDGFDEALKEQIKTMFKTFVVGQENVRQEMFSSMGLRLAVESYKMGLAAIEESLDKDVG